MSHRQTSSLFHKSLLITSSWVSLIFQHQPPQQLSTSNGTSKVLPPPMGLCFRYRLHKQPWIAGQILLPSLVSQFSISRHGSVPMKQTTLTQTLTSVFSVLSVDARSATTEQLAINVSLATTWPALWLAKNVIWLTAKLASQWEWRKFAHANSRSQSSISRTSAATSSRLSFMLTQSYPSPLCSRR